MNRIDFNRLPELESAASAVGQSPSLYTDHDLVEVIIAVITGTAD